MKNRQGLWLSLFVSLAIFSMTFAAWGRISLLSSSNVAIIPPDPFGLGFQSNCLQCHIFSMPDVTYYCHGVLPTENDYYLRSMQLHLDWIITTLNVPTNVYAPPAPSQNEVQVHIFALSLLPVNVNIKVGTMVTWTNLEPQACTLFSNVTLPAGPFDRIIIMPGQSFSYAYNKAGVFGYRCQTGPAANNNVQGGITVN